MTSDFVYRQYIPGDEEAIVELLELVFDGWPNFDIGCTPLEHWRWKYMDNPLEIYIITVAEVEGQIVGVNHALPVTLSVGGESMPSSYISDTVVHPDHQGKGVYKGITELKNRLRRQRGESFGYLVTSNPILINKYDEGEAHRRLPSDAVNLVYIRDIDEQLDRMKVQHPFLVKYGYLLMSYLNRVRHNLGGIGKVERDFRVREASEFDDRIDGFMREVTDCYDLIVKRDRSYLNWRYLDPRAGGYTVKTAECDDKLLGYAVYKINRARPEYPIGYIVDLLTLAGRDDVAEALIANSLQALDEGGVNLTNLLTTKGSPFMKPALRQGLVDSRADINAYIMEVIPNEKLDQLYKSSETRIHFTYGDIDSLPSQMPENINL